MGREGKQEWEENERSGNNYRLGYLGELFFLHRKMETASHLEKYIENVNYLKLNVLTVLEK